MTTDFKKDRLLILELLYAQDNKEAKFSDFNVTFPNKKFAIAKDFLIKREYIQYINMLQDDGEVECSLVAITQAGMEYYEKEMEERNNQKQLNELLKEHKNKPMWWERTWVQIIMFIGAIVGIIGFVLLFGNSEVTQNHSGSGDNVAGNKIVNQTELPQRHLTQEDVGYINNNLPEDKGIYINVLWLRMDSEEPENFASEIMEYLKMSGYVNIRGIEVIQPDFPDGLSIKSNENGTVSVKIGKGPKSIIN